MESLSRGSYYRGKSYFGGIKIIKNLLIKNSLIFLFLVIFSNSVLAITINEIFYDYPGADEDHEWIEIYNDDNVSVDLNGWKFFEDNINHKLKLIEGSLILNPGDYAVIAEDSNQFLLDYSNFNSTLIDSSFSLSNTGETLILKNSSLVVVFNITYFSSWGGDGNNRSICLFNSDWKECGLTPGYDNSLFIEDIVEGDYSAIKINEFLPNPNGYDNSDKPEGEFIELYNDGEEDFNLDKFYFRDDHDSHKIFISDTNTLGGTTIKSKDHLVIYTRYGNGFLNNEGYERIRLYDFNDNLLDEVSYGGSTEGGSWAKIKKNWYKTIPTPNEENIYDRSFSESILLIEKVYLGSDKKAKFGDNLRVKVIVYKGNSSKTSISLWIENNKEKISKTTKFNVDEKYTNSTFTVPLQLFPNCNSKLKDGLYDVVIKGLDVTSRYEIKIEGITKSLCDTIKVQKERIKSIDYDLISSTDQVLVGENIETVLLIRNNDEGKKEYEVWSYIYRGKKSYSGEREENKQIIKIPQKSSATIKLKNIVKEEGDYNLKVKVKKEDRKTTEDLTKSIKIIGNSVLDTNDNSKISYEKDSILFTSSDLKARRGAMLFFNFALILIIIQLVIRKIL